VLQGPPLIRLPIRLPDPSAPARHPGTGVSARKPRGKVPGNGNGPRYYPLVGRGELRYCVV
jgi:hypothetical protein